MMACETAYSKVRRVKTWTPNKVQPGELRMLQANVESVKYVMVSVCASIVELL